AYAGLVPTTRSSGGKTTHGPVGHASNRWLKWILVEIVQTLKQAPGPVGDQYRRLLRAKGKPNATTAAARKLCCYNLLYLLDVEGRPELRGVARWSWKGSLVGGAPGSTHGSGGVA